MDLDFEPLDVFRWEVCELAVADARRADDVPELFASELRRLMHEHPGIPLAVRVVVSGRSQAHEQLIADPLTWTQHIRATAVDVGTVWVEKVKFKTAAVGEWGDDALVDGPIGELLRYFRELHHNEPQLMALAEELADLRRKLPDELIHGEDALALQNPDRLREWLREVQPLLVSRLVETIKK